MSALLPATFSVNRPLFQAAMRKCAITDPTAPTALTTDSTRFTGSDPPCTPLPLHGLLLPSGLLLQCLERHPLRPGAQNSALLCADCLPHANLGGDTLEIVLGQQIFPGVNIHSLLALEPLVLRH